MTHPKAVDGPGPVTGRWAHPAILLLAVAASLAALALGRTESPVLLRLLGGVEPVLVAVPACLLGLVALRVLRASGWIAPEAPGRRLWVILALLGAVLTTPVILLDLLGAFPREMNLPPSEAWYGYPAIAVVAEFLFHVLPLGAVALAGRTVGRTGQGPRHLAYILAALPEPVLQVIWGAGHSPAWANAVVGLHLLVFNAVALALLRYRGFLAAWMLRLGYYLVWHMIWGQLRTGLLFPS